MISEQTFQAYGRHVARAADEQTGDWEPVVQTLLDLIEAQDRALDELQGRVAAMERSQSFADAG